MKKIRWIFVCILGILVGSYAMECFAVAFQKKFSTRIIDDGSNIISITCTEINNHDYIIVAGNGMAITHDKNCKYCKYSGNP